MGYIKLLKNDQSSKNASWKVTNLPYNRQRNRGCKRFFFWTVTKGRKLQETRKKEQEDKELLLKVQISEIESAKKIIIDVIVKVVTSCLMHPGNF